MKIDANAERGDESAKLVVKVDLEGSWAAFGKDLGSSGLPSWSQVEPSWPILASSGCSWAPFGRILVPKSCQHGPQGIPRRLQEWIFGGFSADFNADFTYLYQQVSKYERHWAAAQDTVCRARGPRRKTHYVLHESRGLLGRWACSCGCRL